ncbi:MAG TPA: holo-ACP synthase [Candidatus Obscuribacter sp.]|nr:holo-ACP synthase [Candidatus Obscuribacter sp.]
MCIVGHGIDVVDVERFSKLIEKGGAKFLERCFVEAELNEASHSQNERLSAWFAIKEAVLKALGTGLACGTSMSEIQVVHNELGAPSVVLFGHTEELATKIGVKKWFISLSHIEKIAVASAIACA